MGRRRAGGLQHERTAGRMWNTHGHTFTHATHTQLVVPSGHVGTHHASGAALFESHGASELVATPPIAGVQLGLQTATLWVNQRIH